MKDLFTNFLREKLGTIQRTLMIPLAARTDGVGLFPHLDPHDETAFQIIEVMHADTQKYINDWTSTLNILWRTDVIKKKGIEFFSKHENSIGINLGAGLSCYFQWLDNGKNKWIDADLYEVMRLRKSCMQQQPRSSEKIFDLTKTGWWKEMNLPNRKSKKPIFLVCEGVLMYLTPETVRSIVQEIGENAPNGSQILIDFISPIGVGKATYHPSVSQTGAEFLWGSHNAKEISELHPRLTVLEQYNVSEAYGLIGIISEILFNPITGGPMYAIAHLEIDNK